MTQDYQRSQRPNYKRHTITALGLSILITVVANGKKVGELILGKSA
jgi:hypothetical protein